MNQNCRQMYLDLAKSFLTFVCAGLILIFGGCKSSSKNASTEKDAVAWGKSDSGQSEISLDFYPIRNGQIQMERCTRQYGTSERICKQYCTDANTLENKFRQDGVSNADSLMAAIATPGARDFGAQFKTLQSTLLSLVNTRVAQVCENQYPFHPPIGVSQQTVPARRTNGLDDADSYTLMPNGDLFRNVNGVKCQVTTLVDDFKVAKHPRDAALVYFVKGETLWVVTSSREAPHGPCPRTEAVPVMSNIGKENGELAYWVTSNENTPIVSAAKDIHGGFVAWVNSRAAYSTGGIVNVEMNSCFGEEGKEFSTFVGFLLNTSGTVLKLKGNPANNGFSSEVNGTFQNLNQFKEKFRVCL